MSTEENPVIKEKIMEIKKIFQSLNQGKKISIADFFAAAIPVLQKVVDTPPFLDDGVSRGQLEDYQKCQANMEEGRESYDELHLEDEILCQLEVKMHKRMNGVLSGESSDKSKIINRLRRIYATFQEFFPGKFEHSL